jgi:hypothetical protein
MTTSLSGDRRWCAMGGPTILPHLGSPHLGSLIFQLKIKYVRAAIVANITKGHVLVCDAVMTQGSFHLRSAIETLNQPC